MMPTCCIVGASGFIGRRTLVRLRSAHPSTQLRVLEHRTAVAAQPGTTLVRGDAADPASLEELIVQHSVIVNFAFGGESEAGPMAHALAAASAKRGAKRIVHLSSCSVYGTTRGGTIDEESPCAPATGYERAKHEAEIILSAAARHGCEVILLRPTAVFGPGGRNLESLVRRVQRSGRAARYLRACAMGRRRMNAVDVECVAAAVQWLASAPMMSPIERFIVSQDDEPGNDYASVEAFFAGRFGIAPYPFPPLAIPPRLFSLVLGLAGRSVTDPERRYSAAKLAGRGFRAPRSFEDALREYAASFTIADARP